METRADLTWAAVPALWWLCCNTGTSFSFTGTEVAGSWIISSSLLHMSVEKLELVAASLLAAKIPA